MSEPRIHLEEYRRAVDSRIEALCACVPEYHRPALLEIVQSAFNWNTDEPGLWAEDDVKEATEYYELAYATYGDLQQAYACLHDMELREVARLRGRVS